MTMSTGSLSAPKTLIASLFTVFPSCKHLVKRVLVSAWQYCVQAIAVCDLVKDRLLVVKVLLRLSRAEQRTFRKAGPAENVLCGLLRCNLEFNRGALIPVDA
jgi:hypothetical protein